MNLDQALERLRETADMDWGSVNWTVLKQEALRLVLADRAAADKALEAADRYIKALTAEREAYTAWHRENTCDTNAAVDAAIEEHATSWEEFVRLTAEARRGKP